MREPPWGRRLSAWLTWSADHLREWAKQLDASVTSAEAQQAQARSGAAPIGSSPSGPPEHWRRLVAERAPHLLDPISPTPSVADAPRPVSAVPRIDHADRQGQMLSPQQREHRDVTIPATPPTAPPADMADRPILWQRGPRLSATQAPLKATDVARRPKPMAPDHEPPPSRYLGPAVTLDPPPGAMRLKPANWPVAGSDSPQSPTFDRSAVDGAAVSDSPVPPTRLMPRKAPAPQDSQAGRGRVTPATEPLSPPGGSAPNHPFEATRPSVEQMMQIRTIRGTASILAQVPEPPRSEWPELPDRPDAHQPPLTRVDLAAHDWIKVLDAEQRGDAWSA